MQYPFYCAVKQYTNFDVLLTVHYSNDQFLFQLMHHNFILLTKSFTNLVVIREEVEPVAVYV